MAAIQSPATAVPWDDSTVLSAEAALPWDDGTLVTSVGGPFTPGTPPVGSTPAPGPAVADSLAADRVLPAQTTYPLVHTTSVIDLRDDTPVLFDSLSIGTDEAASVWTLNATKSVAGAELFARMTDPGDPPVLQVTVDGLAWNFIIEGVSRPREFGKTGLTITGRSVTIIAGQPYSFVQNWVNEGPVTAAQLVDQAQLYTGLQVTWLLEDWLIPDKVWTFSGSPLEVVQRVAESVGAVVRSDRTENALTIEPRYREMFNLWPFIAPDVEIFAEAVVVDRYDRADKPAYNGVHVSGQQQGAVGLVVLAGTSGTNLAPLVTDLLLTDLIAVQQRGIAILGAVGPQANVGMTLPVMTGGTYPGVFNVGWICRVREGSSIWYGRVKSVQLNVGLPSVLQTVVLERHTATIDGTVIPVAPPAPPPPPPAAPSRITTTGAVRITTDGSVRAVAA